MDAVVEPVQHLAVVVWCRRVAMLPLWCQVDVQIRLGPELEVSDRTLVALGERVAEVLDRTGLRLPGPVRGRARRVVAFGEVGRSPGDDRDPKAAALGVGDRCVK